MAGACFDPMTIHIMLWAAAFIVPSFIIGVPLPAAPYVLIPALAVTYGFTDRHAVRRILLWIGLVLFYELVYHIPTGVLALPVAAMAILHVVSARVFRIEPKSVPEYFSLISLTRKYAGGLIWMFALILLSAWLGNKISGMPAVSPRALYTVWWHHGALVSTMLGLAVVLTLLHIDRRKRKKFVFTDHAVIQAQNIPG